MIPRPPAPVRVLAFQSVLDAQDPRALPTSTQDPIWNVFQLNMCSLCRMRDYKKSVYTLLANPAQLHNIKKTFENMQKAKKAPNPKVPKKLRNSPNLAMALLGNPA